MSDAQIFHKMKRVYFMNPKTCIKNYFISQIIIIITNSYGLELVVYSSSELFQKFWISVEIWQVFLDGITTSAYTGHHNTETQANARDLSGIRIEDPTTQTATAHAHNHATTKILSDFSPKDLKTTDVKV